MVQAVRHCRARTPSALLPAHQQSHSRGGSPHVGTPESVGNGAELVSDADGVTVIGTDVTNVDPLAFVVVTFANCDVAGAEDAAALERDADDDARDEGEDEEDEEDWAAARREERRKTRTAGRRCSCMAGGLGKRRGCVWGADCKGGGWQWPWAAVATLLAITAQRPTSSRTADGRWAPLLGGKSRERDREQRGWGMRGKWREDV